MAGPASPRTARPRPVLFVAFDGLQPLDLVGPHEVFATANSIVQHNGGGLPYDISVAGRVPTVRTESGLELCVRPLPGPRTPIDTLILPGGDGVHGARHDAELVAWVRAAAARSRRVASVCTGAFLAAAAGLLDGRTVTTHWARAGRLAAEFPRVTVDPDPIYRRDGDVWTSAGVTAGVDLALALVEDDLGSDVAQTVARWLVMFLHRPGGQSQFATPVWAPRARHAAVRAVQEHIERHPGEDLRLERLAGLASMSPRHLTRVFTEEVGEPPARYVERVRIESARALLERSDDTLDAVAARCGFGTAETLRRTFHRHLAVAPDQYRRRFRTVA